MRYFIYYKKKIIYYNVQQGIVVTTRVFFLSSTHTYPLEYKFPYTVDGKIFGLVSSVFLVQISDNIEKMIRQKKIAIFSVSLIPNLLLEAEET